jgi:hypothetical protein
MRLCSLYSSPNIVRAMNSSRVAWAEHVVRMRDDKYKVLFHELRGKRSLVKYRGTMVYPKVSGLAAWNENCKWYSSLPLRAVVSLFCESV